MERNVEFVRAVIANEVPKTCTIYEPLDSVIPEKLSRLAKQFREMGCIDAVWWGHEFLAVDDGVQYVCMDFMLSDGSLGVVLIRLLGGLDESVSC